MWGFSLGLLFACLVWGKASLCHPGWPETLCWSQRSTWLCLPTPGIQGIHYCIGQDCGLICVYLFPLASASFILFFIFILRVWVFSLYTSVHHTHVCLVPVEARRGHHSPWDWVIEGCALPCGCWESNPVLLTADILSHDICFLHLLQSENGNWVCSPDCCISRTLLSIMPGWCLGRLVWLFPWLPPHNSLKLST